MSKTCFVLLPMFLIVLAISISDFMIVKAKLCEKPSKTWYGNCKDAAKCDKQCIEWEGADHGSCHQREAKYMCFCYTQCGPNNTTPAPPGDQKPSPPGGGGKPAPSPGAGGGKPSPPDSGKAAPTPGGGDGKPSPPGSGGPPSDSGKPTPSPGGGQPSPPDSGKPAPSPGGGSPAPPDNGKPAPPPGCTKLVIDKLIAEALANYKTQVEKVSRL